MAAEPFQPPRAVRRTPGPDVVQQRREVQVDDGALPVDHVLRAWQDPIFRAGLDEGDLARLPESPVGALDLADLPED